MTLWTQADEDLRAQAITNGTAHRPVTGERAAWLKRHGATTKRRQTLFWPPGVAYRGEVVRRR